MSRDRTGDSLAYDGPVIGARQFPGAAGGWIWIANGTSSKTFSAPAVRRPPPPPPPEGFSADRIIESFRAEALGVGDDSFLDELQDDDFDAEESGPQYEHRTDPSQISSAMEIRVLGPVEARGWRSPPERPVVLELACYLALHRDRSVSGENLRMALRPDGSKEQSAKTLRTYLSMLRKGLGPDALPPRASGGYQLSASLTTDWERFVELSQFEEVEHDLEALSLIRGRPFEGVARGTYSWVFSEFLVSETEVAVASIVTRVVGQMVETGDFERALSALRQGLRSVTSDYGLWDLYVSVATQAGPAELARARQEARAALGDDAPVE